jgi:ADP-ribosylglycohydrolase
VDGSSEEEELAQRFLPVVIGARAGDAMGTPTEGMTFEAIRDRFGWVDWFTGDGTDDSLLATLLADALLNTVGHAGLDEWAAEWVGQRPRILAKSDRFFPPVLDMADKLADGVAPRHVATGTMASSSSAMSIWPVGLLHAGDPRAAAAHAYALAALIHVGEVAFCQDAAAAVAAAVAVGLRDDTDVGEVTREALATLHPVSGAPMRKRIAEAVTMADEVGGYDAFRERFVTAFGQQISCDSRETVPAAFALTTLAGGELRTAVEFAANFGRDTDTIATMTGAICGAIGGPDAIPGSWTAAIGPAALLEAKSLARRLAELARALNAEHARLSGTVPGLAG